MTAKGVIYYYIPSGIAMMRVVVGVWWFVEARGKPRTLKEK
jgi:hypothetical protein